MAARAIITLIIFVLLTEKAASASAPIITLSSYITANNATNSTWVSPSGEFAFGFRRVAPAGYLLATWFDGLPEKTIVWSANRDNLAPEGSRIQLSSDGRFRLDDPNGREIWRANVAGVVTYAAMLDTGNFVLSNNLSNTLWQSFDEPTDTLLPSQIFRRGSTLIASFSMTNYSRGRFMLRLQDDGDLVLSTRNVTAVPGVIIYWRTDTSRTRSQLIFNQSGHAYLANQNSSTLASLFPDHDSTGDLYRRIVLEYNGVLKYQTHPKHANSSSSWVYGVSFLPTDICDQVTNGNITVAAGACGENSICSYGSDHGRPNCSCPRSYSWVDSTDTLGGCKPDFQLQSCDFNGTGNFSLVDLSNTNFYYGDSGVFGDTDACRRSCLEDCGCAAVVQDGIRCWKKKFPLMYGRAHSGVWTLAMLKIRTSNTTVIPARHGTGRSNRGSVMAIIGWVLFGSSLLVNLALISLLVFAPRRKRWNNKSGGGGGYRGLHLRWFSFRELEEATDGFTQELGRGAFAIVYKGIIEDENGERPVAVKRLKKVELEQEFVSEIMSISMTNHRNLVQLIGFCDEGENRILVYEFMSNGSLATLLFGGASPSPPSWDTRAQIAVEIARGLLYLHEECNFQIIHCDIKPHNVLLDASNVAKIADFGLAKLLMPDQTRTSTMARGTTGYMAPEWLRSGRITTKVDVYSFGTMLLELVCCRKKYEAASKTENEVILVESAYEYCQQGELHLLAMEDDGSRDDIERFQKFVMIAIWCMQEDPSARPTMKTVVNMLEGSMHVPLPPGVSIA